MLLRLSPALVLLAVVLYLIVDTYARRAAERSFDHLLAASALSIADSVQNESGGVTVDLPYASHAILANQTSSRIFYRVTAPDGTLVTGYKDLAPGLGPAVSAAPAFSYADFLGARVRVVKLGRFVSGSGSSGWVTVVAAQSTEDQTRFAVELVRYAFFPTLAMMILATGLIWVAIRQSLKPLDEIERAIAASDPNSLKTLDIPVPWEIHHLVGALNALIERLNALLMRMQDFIAESAHQIRSPLANLRSQLELARNEAGGPAAEDHLRNVYHSAVLVSRLANQLLADTMIAHRGEVSHLVPVDLLELVEAVADEFSDRSGARINLDVGALHDAPIIAGDMLMLQEATKNLLDNALKYAGPGQPITVSLASAPGGAEVVLAIADRGPGIPPAERAAVLSRFFRGANAGETVGSGLGLAIVAKVVERHDGRLSLGEREGGGLEVVMRFRKDSTPAEAP